MEVEVEGSRVCQSLKNILAILNYLMYKHVTRELEPQQPGNSTTGISCRVSFHLVLHNPQYANIKTTSVNEETLSLNLDYRVGFGFSMFLSYLGHPLILSKPNR